MRKSFVALLLMLGAAASMTGLALAAPDDLNGDLGNKLINGSLAKERLSRAARQSTASITAAACTTWLGQAPTGAFQWGPNHLGWILFIIIPGALVPALLIKIFGINQADRVLEEVSK